MRGLRPNSYSYRLNHRIPRYRSPADFEEGNIRLFLPRWTAENFFKNLILVDKVKEAVDKYNATLTQATLAWILAGHPTCTLPFFNKLCVDLASLRRQAF